MNVQQLRNSLQGVPDDALLFVSLGDPIPENNWEAYQARYNRDKNIFYVQYFERKK